MVGQASSLSIRNDGQSRETRDRRHQIIFFSGHYLRIAIPAYRKAKSKKQDRGDPSCKKCFPNLAVLNPCRCRVQFQNGL